MKNWWTIALGVVFGLLGAGIIWLVSQPPRGTAIKLLPPPTPLPIQIHIIGEVNDPGVYALSVESRVKDAVEAAGGFTDYAKRSALNLAAPLEDGIQIQVPLDTQIEAPTLMATSVKDNNDPSKNTNPPIESNSNQININSADQPTLETLSGIGPVIAQEIISFREEYGPFKSIEEIQKVSGIGPVKFENIRDFITVDEQR